MPLTPQQQSFVTEYLKTSNATSSAIAAGYKKESAHSQGSRLLKHAEIQAALARRRAKYDITADRVLSEVAKLAFANMADYISIGEDGQAYVDLSKCTPEQLAAISEIKVDESAGGSGDGRRERVQRTTFKLCDKTANLTLLMRNMKLLTDKVELSTADELADRMAKARRSVTLTTGGMVDAKSEAAGVEDE